MAPRFWNILGRRLTGEITLEELQELEEMLQQDPELYSIVELHDQYFYCPNEDASDQEDESWLKQQHILAQHFPEDFNEQQPASNKLKNKRRRILYYFAAACTLLAVFALQLFRTSDRDIQNTLLSTNTSDITVNILPDGSKVWLNKNSRIKYDEKFGITNRDIHLTGEGFFDVKHMNELPMIVHAGKVKIKVLGTAFNVKYAAGTGKVETSLIRGRVELYNGEDKLILQPNDKVVIDENLVPEKEHIVFKKLNVEPKSGLIPEIAWINNRIVFNEEPFEEVAKKIEEKYNVKIIIEDKELKNEKFTGSFYDETLDIVLTALQLAYDFNYSKSQDKIIITK
ncbi:MAG TPA: FecR family protein [Niabella sp.]|nr:FecR family protein [Niabella sp.]